MAMCRACGQYPGDPNRLTESLQKYFDIYYNLTSIRLTTDEDPNRQRICDDCHSKLLEYNRFRSVCLQVHYKLMEIKEEVDLDQSNTESVVCHPLVAPLKVERLEFEEVDKDEDAIKKDVDDVEDENDDYDEGDEEDEDEAEEEESADVKDPDAFDEETYNELEAEEDSDGDYKPQKKRKKRQKKSDGPKEQLLSCDQCDKKFRSEQRLQGHLRTHQGLKAAVCDLCGKEFHKFYNLKLHMTRKHSDVKHTFTCDFPDCGSSYSTKQGLTNHRRKHDPNFVQPVSKRVVCDQCGKTFSTAGALKKHSYIHSGDMPFQCQKCNKKLPTAHKLKEHTMRHEGVRNHVCPLCGLKKTTRHELTVHMNYHTREKQFTCHVCAQVFSNIGNMSRHIKIVHCGIKAYNCTFCDRSFGKAETLKHHVMTHTGEKPHECQVCGKRFIQSVALQTHMKTHRKHLPQEPKQATGLPYQHPNLGQQRSAAFIQAAAAAAAAATVTPMMAMAPPQQIQLQQEQQSPDGSSMGDYVNQSV